jgi:RNA polymerase sigma-70 factor, ECF subfamily
VSVVEFWPPGLGVEIIEVNGGPGALITTRDRPFLVFALDIDQTSHRLREVNAVLNPDKLSRVANPAR